jgi:O-antigen ligase
VTSLLRNRNFLFSFFAALFIACITQAVAEDQYYLMVIPFVAVLFYAGWISLRFIFLLLLFTLPLSIEYQFSESLGTDFPDEFLMLLVAGLFLCNWVYRPWIISRHVWSHPLIILLAISVCWMITSALFSTEPLFSLKFLLAKGWYICAFVLVPLILFQDKGIIHKAITMVTLAMVIIAIIILVRHAFDGFTFATINNALKPFFRNHVNYSAMLVCVIPVVYVYIQTAKYSSQRTIAIIVLAILLSALVLSYSRGAWLALLVGIATVWLIRKKALVFSYIVMMLIVIGALFWIKHNDRYLEYAHDYKTTVWHENFREHFRATYQFRDASTAERFYRWIAGVRMIKDNPLTGYGPNSFYYNYKPYAIPAYKTWVSDNREHSTVHNYFLLVTIEQGIPGLIFFLLLTTAMLYYAQRLYHRVQDVFYKRIAMVTGVVMMMILTVNFLSDLIETDKIGSLFFLCLALLIVTDILNPSSHMKSISQPVSE